MKFIRFFMPRVEYILLAALFWSLAASGPKLLNFDGDLPRHLLLGQLIRETRHVPTTDTFSFRTEGLPSIPHEWLSQVIFSAANDVMGLSGVVLLTAIIITLTWGIVYQEAFQRSSNLFVSLSVVALGIASSMIHVLPRPHIFTYLFTALWIALMERIQKDQPRLGWVLPLVMALWVNMHGMFVLGMIIWGIYVAGSFLENPSRAWFEQASTRSMLMGGALSLFATFLSPSGPGIWEAIASLGSNSYITSRIPEYQSANFHLPETWPFILLLVITITAFARAVRKPGWTYILLTISFTAVALYSSRMIPLFAIVVVPVAASVLGDWVRQQPSESRLSQAVRNISLINSTSSGVIWIFVVIVLVALLFRSGGSIDPQNKGNVFDAKFFPVEAVDWLHSNPQHGHMLNEFDWGGYLLLNLSPPQQIFMDGHTHIYGEALTREYEAIVSLGDGWQGILDKYEIEWVIVRVNSPVAGKLEDNGWTIMYQDDTSIILRQP